MSLSRTQLAQRAAQELHGGDYVNLGIGIPTLCSNYIPEGVDIKLQSENGLLGIGPYPDEAEIDPDLINAGKETISEVLGASYFSSSEGFEMVRGRHIDLAILGAMQVSEQGDLANWMIPGKMVKGPGGGMDLVVGAKRIVIVMDHVARNGDMKVLTECSLPLTGKQVVDRIVSSMATIDVTADGLRLLERAPGVTVEEIVEATEPELIIDGDIPEMKL